MKKTLLAIFVAGAFLAGSSEVIAHSGGTDAYGCHTNSKTGVYHCHNPKNSDAKKHRHSKRRSTKK
jgi:uncharacterized protein YfaQ (DUF2300 family)